MFIFQARSYFYRPKPMSGYHKLTGPYKIRTLKNWLLCFGWFSVREILVKLTLYWVVQLADVSCVQNVYLARWGSHSTADKWPCKLGDWSFFFPKSRKFQVKMENGIKWNSLDSRHVFQSFSLPSSNKRAEKPFSEFLGRFSVILGVPPTGPKKGVPVQTNSAFTPKFKYNGYKTYFSSNKNSHRSGKNFGVNFFL